ncbi:hypothetical protein [Gordonia soli]|uniref:Putative anti-sigma factor n=1 Tax=Gordonia soli NBRC 108243 TaxID=1223545 RepID=M0QNW4_9ACTN|nr:hypothetical protein [Gordonia soli]GAC69951.1 putative anti-sigma factor [Gordonia soli NBRC 108243]
MSGSSTDVSVELTVCASAPRLSLVRQVVGDVAAATGFDPIDAIDLTVAVDAICALVMSCSAETHELRCVVNARSRGADVHVTGRLAERLRLPEDDFAWRTARAMVDDVQVSTSDDHVAVTCRKTRSLR